MEISVDRAISDMIQAQSDATKQKVAFAVAGKQLSAQKQQGEAIVSLVEQAANVQKQIAAGHLDVRV